MANTGLVRDAQGRSLLQNYSNLELWLTEKFWQALENDTLDKRDVTSALCRHAATLGLQCPSEKTLSTFFVLLNHRDQKIWTSPVSLNSGFGHMKACVRTEFLRLGHVAGSLGYLPELPQDTQRLPDHFLIRVFGATRAPAESRLGPGYMQRKREEIPLRKSRSILQTSSAEQCPSPTDAIGSLALALLGFQGQKSLPGILPPNEKSRSGQAIKLLPAGLRQLGSDANVPIRAGPGAAQSSLDPPLTTPEILPLEAVAESQTTEEERVQAAQITPLPPPEIVPVGQPKVENKEKNTDALRALSHMEVALKAREANKKDKTKQPGKPKPKSKAKSHKKKTAKGTRKAKPSKKADSRSNCKKQTGSKANSTTSIPSPLDTRAKKRERVEEIWKSLDRGTQRKFSSGCARCRWVKRCTLSCWILRGFS